MTPNRFSSRSRSASSMRASGNTSSSAASGIFKIASASSAPTSLPDTRNARRLASSARARRR
jgi:hypothetical protein